MEWFCKLQLIIHWLSWVLARILKNLLLKDPKGAAESEGEALAKWLGPSLPGAPALSAPFHSLSSYLAETEEAQAPKPA